MPPLRGEFRSLQPEPPVAFNSGTVVGVPRRLSLFNFPRSTETDEIGDTGTHCHLSRLARAATLHSTFSADMHNDGRHHAPLIPASGPAN